MEVIFCDVGQGDATLVTYKNWQMLIDTGPNNKKVLTCLSRNMPFWDKTIELLMITHGDSDHTGGLTDISKYYKIEQSIYSKNVKQFDLIRTDWMTFEVVNSGLIDDNENSIAGILNYKNTKIFFSGDITAEVEKKLVWQGILKESVDILKVSHHGSKDGTSEELLNVLKPKLAVISVGAKNRFGHPTKEVLNRLKEKGIEIKRTDQDGEVHVIDN
ncbi:MAG: MBL fold metallo-hydrolase [Candidatus Shapirobacteria bacterium]|nr:MBL fold metallo-hydrolase [Candidatus Shapirobacteria bacterium]